MIAKREGFGDILADGADRAADRLGLGDKGHYYSITTRGMTLPGDDSARPWVWIRALLCSGYPGRL